MNKLYFTGPGGPESMVSHVLDETEASHVLSRVAFFAACILRRSNHADFVADSCTQLWPNYMFGAHSGFISLKILVGLPKIKACLLCSIPCVIF